MAAVDVPLVLMVTTSMPAAMSLIPPMYDVAPLEAFQLTVTALLPSVGPGLLSEPGVRLVGVAGDVGDGTGV